MIVVVAPCRNHAAGMAQRREQVFVQAFFSHPSVEAFHQTVLHAPALALLASRLDEVERLTALIEDGGHTYPTDSGMVRARPEVGMRNEAMRHAQSLLIEFGLTPAARSRVSASGKASEKNLFAALERI